MVASSHLRLIELQWPAIRGEWIRHTTAVDHAGIWARAVPGLHVLTSGPIPPNAAEILGSARMQEVISALAAAADVVILDSPPVLAMSDAAILASQVDGVLLVLDATGTRRELAVRALEGLLHVQAQVVGVVLNRVSRERSGYYYYYYHDYYDRASGNGAGSGNERGKWPWQQKGQRRHAPDPVAPASTPRSEL